MKVWVVIIGSHAGDETFVYAVKYNYADALESLMNYILEWYTAQKDIYNSILRIANPLERATAFFKENNDEWYLITDSTLE